MTALLVRRAGPDDFEAIRSLAARANEEFRAPMGPTLYPGYLANVLDVAGRAREAELLVAEIGHSIVGTVTFYPDANDEGMSTRFPVGTAGIRATAVDPSARGVGIGHRLVGECLDRARAAGARLVALHTAECMTAAIALYRGYGFERDPAHDFLIRDFFGGAIGPELVALAHVLDVARGH